MCLCVCIATIFYEMACMNKQLKYVRILWISRIIGAAVLTFLFGLLPTARLSFASDFTDNNQGYATAALLRPSGDNAFAKEARKARMKEIAEYAKKEIPNWLPGLPSFLRTPKEWMMRNVKSIGGGVGDAWEVTGGNDVVVAFTKPIEEAMTAPEDDVAHALWLKPDYNHKGFLPLHDALMIGVNSRHRLWGDAMTFNIHPHVGQNWRNSENFWGTDITFNFTKPGKEKGDARRTLGKIAISYANGDKDVMKRKRGIDMHSEFQFTDDLSLRAGMKRNDDSKLDSYVLMQWKLADF